MTIRVYLSNIAPGWSIQQQQEMLADHLGRRLGTPDWTYIDRLSAVKRKAHAASSLTQRTALLRDTSRSKHIEAVIIVSLACLAWEQVDFLQCVAAIGTHGATLIALDTDRRIAPDASPTEIADAAQEFVARRRAAKGGMGQLGYLVSAERRATEAKAAALCIKDRWQLPTKDYPTDALLAEVGICRNTANLYLGKRPDAQRKHRNAAARNRVRRIPVEVQEQVA
jgi:hypothetical protein